jgi:hypothetical protein
MLRPNLSLDHADVGRPRRVRGFEMQFNRFLKIGHDTAELAEAWRESSRTFAGNLRGTFGRRHLERRIIKLN